MSVHALSLVLTSKIVFWW